jgi:hypothetical protein
VTASPAYAERLGVPLRWWVQGTMFVATLWLAVVVAVPGPTAWVTTAIALAALAGGLGAYGNARVSIEGTTFRAGRAHIDATYVGTATALDADQTRRAAGVEANARAYLVMRPYLKRAVKVEITDPADPTPYWLVSSRRPDQLASALTALAASARGSNAG